MKTLRKKFSYIYPENIIKFLLLSSVFSFLFIFLILPLIKLILKAFQDENGLFIGLSQFKKYFSNSSLISSIEHTFFIAITSTLISVILAFAFSYILTRKNIPFKRLFRYITMLPLFSPTMLLGICLIYLFGNKGIVTNLGIYIPLYGQVGIIIAETIYCFPVATTILTVAFSSADNRLYEAAEVLGASGFKKMLTITIPNIKYGLMSAIFVCFTYSFTDFGAPITVGGNYNVLAVDIYTQVLGLHNFSMGAVTSIIMLFPAVIAFILDRLISQKQNSMISSRSTPYIIKKHPKSDFVAFAFCFLVSILILAFFSIALLASLIKIWPYDMSFTLEHYNFSELAISSCSQAFKNSILISLISAVLGTVICFLTAYSVEKINKFKIFRRIIYFLSITPLAIPGTVIGLSFIMFFNSKIIPIPNSNLAFLNPFYAIYGTIWIIIFVNLIHFFSIPFTTATTALKKLDKEFEVVSEAMGVPFYKTLIKVTIPLCIPAILEMLVFFFVNSMSTIAAVIFLYTPQIPLASINIVNLQDYGFTAPAAAISIIILLINLVIRLLHDKFTIKIKNFI